MSRILDEADDLAARRVLQLVGIDADNDLARAQVRCYGGLAKATVGSGRDAAASPASRRTHCCATPRCSWSTTSCSTSLKAAGQAPVDHHRYAIPLSSWTTPPASTTLT